MDTREVLKRCIIFADLSEYELDELAAVSERKQYSKGDVLIEEGRRNAFIEVIAKGQVEILKKENLQDAQKLVELGVGDSVGEMSFLSDKTAEATVRAISDVETISIEIATLKLPPYATIQNKLQKSLASLLAQRLSETNVKAAESMQGEIDALKSRLALGYMLITVLFLSASYEFALGFILSLKEYFPNTTPFSVGMLVFYALFLFIAVRRSGYPMASYGVTFYRGLRVTKEAVVWSLPVLVFVLLVKAVFIYGIDGFKEYPLFDPMGGLKGEPTVSTYFVIMFAYALFCPVQEFIARGVLQGSLQMFLGRDSKKNVAVAIVLANLVFASSHMHTTYWFALLSFIPGLFWGYMYFRQRSLVGVSVSHILIGIWVSFVVGFPWLTN